MKKIAIACWFVCLIAGVSHAQSLEKRALKNIEKGKWEKALSALAKAARKREMAALTHYVWARYYFTSGNPSYNIDSAYASTSRSLYEIQDASERNRYKMARLYVDSASLVKLRTQIDSVGFDNARTLNTEEAYVAFLTKHPFSVDKENAEQLRNTVAFTDATNQNTYTAFKSFLEKYPNAAEARDAKDRYERLLFEEKTRDRRLASFERFLKEYPETPFRREIEEDIFELFTLSGEVERFMSFLKLYPESSFRNRATNILFHVLYDTDEQIMPVQVVNDSLRKVVELNEGYLVPFLKKGKFGFMNHAGFEVISPTFDTIPAYYTCGNIVDDVLVLSDKIIGRDGSTIFSGKVDELEDIGAGYLKVMTNNCLKIIHKSGFAIDSCVKDVKVLDRRYLGVATDNGWNVRSLTGRALLAETWDDVSVLGNVLLLKKNKRNVLLTFNQIADLAHEQEFEPATVFDEVKPFATGNLWVTASGNEGVYDQNLKELIPIDDHKIQPYFNGFVIKNRQGSTLANYAGKKSSIFDDVTINDPLIVVKKDGAHFLFDDQQQKFASSGYDSVRFNGAFFTGLKADSLYIHFSDSVAQFSIKSISKYIAGKDSSSFMLVEDGGKKTLYDQHAIALFTTLSTNFESIQHAGGDYFIINKKEKKGLIDSHGKLILPIEYDAIGNLGNQTFSLLRSMRFGLLDVNTRKMIKPQYDKNIIAYKPETLIGFKDGFNAFVDWENKPYGKFGFEEIRYWNDSVALVKRNKLWELYDLTSHTPLLTDIKDVIPVRETADEKVYIMQQNNLFGVYSSQKGKIIPFSFTDLVNIGSADEPLYFTEKHVSEASVFVVIYYDKSGKMLRREVYEDPEDYENIYCQEN